MRTLTRNEAISQKWVFLRKRNSHIQGMSDCLLKQKPTKSLKKVLQSPAGKVSYGTEGGLFYSKGNIPSLICGPGSINKPHKRNEFIEIDQLPNA